MYFKDGIFLRRLQQQPYLLTSAYNSITQCEIGNREPFNGWRDSVFEALKFLIREQSLEVVVRMRRDEAADRGERVPIKTIGVN